MTKLPESLRSRLVVEGGCWLWRGQVSTKGYGRVLHEGRLQQAHRVVYELLVSAIPKGKCLDHLCRVRACVNPAHMEPVDNRTNILRGVSFSAMNAQKKACDAGHPYTEENTRVCRAGWRHCKTCSDIRDASRGRRAAAMRVRAIVSPAAREGE